ncbi:hypothetical protein JL49_16985 [Pseudoalteromonas luteoviolacea]|nr:hypothetical protein JL49_16985 [Pseudoalteromonas luteoviolacea]
MLMNNKGSEWNRWDLHFHTPSSYDYKDKTVTNIEIIEELKKQSIKVFAVTDHHVIDLERYKELRELGKKKGVTVLPGIEFLSDSKGKDPIHFIGIFSEKADIDHIWGSLKYKTDINKVYSENKKPNEVYCNLKDTINLVKELGGIVTIHAGAKHASVEGITNSLPHAMAQKVDIAHIVDIYELGKESDQEGYKKNVFPHIKKYIPMIICSDNHSIKHYKTKQNLWIKGEPSFEGLKHALTEPEGRFHIGAEPEALRRVRQNKTKYIKSLRVKRKGKFEQQNEWFENIEVPLNNELVSIIGNKGSGKSALSDIIALCCDAEHSSDHMFLHKNKFKKRGLADRFTAEVEFESGTTTEAKTLLDSVDENQQRLVRYLPQSYFEKVCNEIGKVDAFRSEIEKVVFQYVPIEQKLGCTSFKSLIDLKKVASEKEIHHLNEQLAQINEEIIALEDQTSPNHKTSLLNSKIVKKQELDVHLANKPNPISDPSIQEETPEILQKKNQLSEYRKAQTEIETELTKIRLGISERSKSVLQCTNLIQEIESIASDISLVKERSQKLSADCNFVLDKVVSFKFNKQIILDTVDKLKKDNIASQKQLELQENWEEKPSDELSLASKLQFYISKANQISSELSGEQKEYQNYLTELQEWEQQEAAIKGDIETPGSLTFIDKEIEYLEKELFVKLEESREKRIDLSLKIFTKKSEIKSFYDEVKTDITYKLESSQVSGLNIASSFSCSNSFVTSLLTHIKQNVTSSFRGTVEGANLLVEELVSPTNWNDAHSVGEFLKNIIEYLEFDKRSDKGSKERTFIGDTTKNREELYNYLFGLKFLDPHYALQQQGKDLEQLSPGEKGALLLVFYLLLDKEDIPLIIDQPEDNLDNNSVAQVLVPYIKEAKKYRQIIMVTHNPNLAIVADSEQIIRVKIDKENNNKFSFDSGGIEQENINNHIVQVLEGTAPAFTSRRDKYKI